MLKKSLGPLVHYYLHMTLFFFWQDVIGGIIRKKKQPLYCAVCHLRCTSELFLLSVLQIVRPITDICAIISAAFLHSHTVISLCSCKIGVLYIHQQLPPHQTYFSHIHVDILSVCVVEKDHIKTCFEPVFIWDQDLWHTTDHLKARFFNCILMSTHYKYLTLSLTRSLLHAESHKKSKSFFLPVLKWQSNLTHQKGHDSVIWKACFLKSCLLFSVWTLVTFILMWNNTYSVTVTLTIFQKQTTNISIN